MKFRFWNIGCHFCVGVIYILKRNMTKPSKIWDALLRTEESSQNKKVKEGFLLVKNVFLNWNTVSHGTLSRDIEFPPKSFYFILVFKWKFRYAYDVLHPGLESFPITSKQWWCHCYIFRGLLCSVFQPGLWEDCTARLLIQTSFWKSSACLLIKPEEERELH